MVFVPSNDGSWVNENFARLAEVIRDYDAQFELRYIPPVNRSDPEDHTRAYCVFDLYSQTPAFFAAADATPEEILGHLFDIDNKHGNVLTRMEARNNAKEALKLKADLDEREEKMEYVQWLMQDQRNYLHLRDRHGEKVKFDDQLRRIE
jgi:gamma-glutamylcyclotransferase (GGCT)/AIG2-like uncharacterized protein YtfP